MQPPLLQRFPSGLLGDTFDGKVETAALVVEFHPQCFKDVPIILVHRVTIIINKLSSRKNTKLAVWSKDLQNNVSR